MTDLAPLLEKYFISHLIQAMNASSHTVASYRDTWRLFIAYVFKTTNTPATQIQIEQLDSECVTKFLQYLQENRHSGISTRNTRLAAIHSFFSYAVNQHPEHAGLIGRVLAVPSKRHEHTDITYLNEDEVTALINAPSSSTRTGRRDQIMLATDITTGMRVSELTGLTWADLHLGAGAHVVCHGKGRKDRATPLDKTTVRALKHWKEELHPSPHDSVFPTQNGTRMSSDAVAQRVAHATELAAKSCITLTTKNVTPHTLRHTAAMRLLHAGVDIAVIALWLGHASLETTQIYLHADMTMKEDALERLKPTGTRSGHYKPGPNQLAFLDEL